MGNFLFKKRFGDILYLRKEVAYILLEKGNCANFQIRMRKFDYCSAIVIDSLQNYRRCLPASALLTN